MMFPAQIFRLSASMRIRSLAQILRRVADPVEPFGFKFVPNHLLPSLPDGIRDSLGKRPGLFGQVDDGQANEFQRMHKRG